MLLQDMVRDVTHRLGAVVSEREFEGEAIQIGDVKIIPMLRLQLGFGGGGGEGDAAVQGSKEGAHGVAGGANGMATLGAVSIRPVGVIVFTKSGVRVLQVKEKRPTIERILDTIPETVERVKSIVRRIDTEDGVVQATATEPAPVAK